MSRCWDCGANVVWFPINGKPTPFNAEEVDDSFDPETNDTHWKSCRKPKEDSTLSVEAKTRPGYL